MTPAREEKRLLIFVHVPKAAGSTLRSILRRQYGSRHTYETPPHAFPPPPETSLGNIRLLAGHVPYGAHATVAVSAHADYITMLRHPVDRIVSLYYYIRRRDQHALQHLVEGRSLAEFAAQNAFVVKNDQVRYVSGEMASAEPSLERAKQNLDAMIAFGIAERFDESVLLFRRRLGWSRKSVCYRRWNVTSDRPRLNEIPSRTLQIIEEQNQLDVALYDHARARFEELTRAQEEGFWSELSRYRFVNRLYAPVSGSVGAAARLVPQPLRRIARDTLDPFRRH